MNTVLIPFKLKNNTVQLAVADKLFLMIILLVCFCLKLSAQTFYFDYSGGPIQQYTIPSGVNYISVEVVGADGGNSVGSNPVNGGRGASASGIFSVSPGDVLDLILGAAGANSTLPVLGENGISYLTKSSGGGDASAVYFMSNPLIIAGGGGGSSGIYPGSGGTNTTNGGASGGNFWVPSVPGGTNGSGGQGGGWSSEQGADAYGGGGGGGYLSPGASGFDNLVIVDLPSAGPGVGGGILKGGGGGTGVDAGYGGGGGGGGYSGGGGAYGNAPLIPGPGNGGGGGSFVSSSAIIPEISAGANGGGNGSNGQVIITLNPCIPVSITSPATSNSPICGGSGNTLNLSVIVSGQGPFNYNWSGPPGALIVNGNTATPFVLGPLSGDYTVTITNNCGSVTSTTTAVVNTAPTISVPGTFNLNTDPGQCFATLNIGDLYSFVSLTGSPTPNLVFTFNSTYPTGNSVISGEAVNVCGSAMANVSVVVTDNEVPSISCPPNMTIGTDFGLCEKVLDFANLVSVADNCGLPILTLSGGLNIVDTLPIGIYPITYTATDQTGNTATCSHTVTIEDNSPPVALCKNIGVELINGLATITSADINDGSYDNCAIQTLSLNALDMVTLDNNSPRLNFVTLTATDIYGLQSSCSAVLVLQEDLCPGNDGVDSDHGGLPDDCDCSPLDAFNDKIALLKDQNIGLDFDGVDDHLLIPHDYAFNPSDSASITFEAWIKPNLNKEFNTIMSKGNGASQTAYIFNVANFNTIGLFLGQLGGGGSWFYADTTLMAGVWVHVAAVYNHQNKTVSFYYNGNLVNTEVVPFTLFAGDTQGVYVGQQGYSCACNHFDGQMDEVRIWSSARSGIEIKQKMSHELKGWEQDLLVYYHFNDGIPGDDNTVLSIILDHSVFSHHALINAFSKNGAASNWVSLDLPLIINNRDTLARCLTCPDTTNIGISFDGIDDEIVINHVDAFNPGVGQSFSFEAWIKPAPGQVAYTILSKGTGSGGQNSYIFSILQDKIALYIADGTQASWIYSNSDIAYNTWNHIAVVYDGMANNFTFYLNGVADGQGSFPLGFYAGNHPVYIGRQGTVCDCNHFLGQMDEVRIWKEARSANQIQNFMNKELFGNEKNLEAYYTFNNGIPQGNNSNVSTTPDVSLHGRDGMVIDFAKTGSNSNWVNTTISMAHTKNTALHFDGFNDYIRIPHDASLIPTSGNAVTYEAWIYPESSANELGFIFSMGSFPNQYHQMYYYNDIKKIILTSDGMSPIFSNTVVPLQTWTHIAIVFNQTETKLYINGKLDNTRTQTLLATDPGFDITIGNQDAGGPSNWNFKGKMDDIRIWSVARNDTEIPKGMHQELTGNETGIAAYYNLNEGLPAGDNSILTKVYDVTNQGHDGTMNGFLKTGSTSNWVSSPLNFGDGDNDGVPDFCDNCVAQKMLLLENHTLFGIYRAAESITLGTGLTLPTNGLIEFRTPKVEVTQVLPGINAAVEWLITPEVCPNE